MSRSREGYLLAYLEKEEAIKVLHTKSITNMLLASMIKKPEMLENALDTIRDYTQITLPSIKQKDKIEDIKGNKEVLKSIKDRLTNTKISRKKEPEA